MISGVVRRLIVIGAMLALPGVGYAQEAALSGKVTDATGGVLPGVTIRALHEATGNSFEAVTDETGSYRIPVRVGGYRITAELSGFTTVTRTGVEVRVGQAVIINLQMNISGVQETVTVTVHDTAHPVSSPWGNEFVIKDEIYRFKNWQPEKVRVLMSLNMAKTKKKEPYHVPIA